MIVVDASALVAILLGEPEANSFLERIAREPTIVSAASVLEQSLLSAIGRGSHADIMGWLSAIGVAVVPMEPEHLVLAFEGRDRFGKGRSEPPAVLNFGDLFAYALARGAFRCSTRAMISP